MDKKDAVIEALREYWRAFENAERVDLVPVVYCGECKYMMPDGHCTMFADDRIRPSSSDFCSAGERKDGNHPSYSDKLWHNAYERGRAEAEAEIIRCKDCVHHIDGFFCRQANHHTSDKDCCASVFRAERRTDEAD